MSYDPYAAAMDADKPSVSRWFGQLYVSVMAVALVKGVGKEPYDEQLHDKPPVTSIDLELIPLAEHEVDFTLERNMVHFSDGWKYVTLPSIKRVGADLRDLHKSYVAVELDETGETFTSNSGKVVKKTAFVLKEVFDSKDACVSAYRAFNEADDEVPFETKSNGDDERAAAAKFLRPVWSTCGGDLEAFSKKLEEMSPLNKFFDLESPEVQEVIG